jgi:Ca2+-transporting ATPase
LWCGLIIGGFAIANYLFFFERSGVSPQHASIETVYQATTITYVTIVMCQLVNIIQRRSVHGFFSRYQLSNRYFWMSIIASIGVVLSITYVPVVSVFFKSGPIGPLDWVFVLGAATLFLGIRELQRVVKKAHRKTA